MTSKSQWCAIAVSVTISNTIHNGLNSVREWSAPSVPIRQNSLRVQEIRIRQQEIYLICIISNSQTKGNQPPSLPNPSLSLYPHLSFPFLSSFLSPTVSQMSIMYQVPNTHVCTGIPNELMGPLTDHILQPYLLFLSGIKLPLLGQ